jgi:hypothetical protein
MGMVEYDSYICKVPHNVATHFLDKRNPQVLGTSSTTMTTTRYLAR